MTDKQIIIDDQKKTIHRLQQECTEKTNTILALGDKLKCKEQECERLKDSLKLISSTLNHHLQWEVDLYKRQIDDSVPDDWEYEEVLVLVEEYIEKLKAENERLQEEREKAKNYNLEYGQLLIKATNKNNKFKQTLTEIKEIAEEYAHNCDFSWECEKCDYSCFSKQILQKISEVESD